MASTPHPLPDPLVATKIDYTPDVAPAHLEGRVFYDSTSKSFKYYNDESEIALDIGRESWLRVKNETGSTITNGQVVYVNGSEAVENRFTVALAKADVVATSKVVGMATHDIENNSFGYITTSGVVHDLNTSAFSDADTLWLSPDTAGAVTVTEPSNPNKPVVIGYVEKSDASIGSVFVSLINSALVTHSTRFGWAVPDTDNSVVTEHTIITAKADRLAAVTVDGVPTTQNHIDSNTAQILVNITTMTSAGTLRLTGTSWDPVAGSETPADTEDIVIAATGYKQSTKHWRGTVVLSSVGGLDVILDSFLWDPFMFEKDFIVDSIQVYYKSTAVANSSRIVVQKFNESSGFTTIVDETISDISDDTKGAHHFASLNTTIAESSGDALFIFNETKRATDYHFEVQGSEV